MRLTLVKKSSVEHTSDLLREAIRAARWPVGAKIPSIRQLTEQLGASPHVIRHAVDALAEEGYVEKRHGSGTYVASLSPSLDLSESVALCANVADHIYSTVSSLLSNRLHRNERLLLNIDFYNDNFESLVTKAARSRIGTFIVQSDAKATTGKAFDSPAFAERRLIALFNTSIPGLDRDVQGVVVDHERGAQLILDYLRREGHKRVLVVGTDTMLGQNPKATVEQGIPHHGLKLLRHLEQLNGPVRILARGPARLRHDRHGFDLEAAVDALTGPNACTAVVGARDVDAADLQLALLTEAGMDPANFEWIGYGDTPWRSMAPVPLISVDWNLETVTAVLDELLGGQREWTPGTAVEVAPFLVTRQGPQKPTAEDSTIQHQATATEHEGVAPVP